MLLWMDLHGKSDRGSSPKKSKGSILDEAAESLLSLAAGSSAEIDDAKTFSPLPYAPHSYKTVELSRPSPVQLLPVTQELIKQWKEGSTEKCTVFEREAELETFGASGFYPEGAKEETSFILMDPEQQGSTSSEAEEEDAHLDSEFEDPHPITDNMADELRNAIRDLTQRVEDLGQGAGEQLGSVSVIPPMFNGRALENMNTFELCMHEMVIMIIVITDNWDLHYKCKVPP